MGSRRPTAANPRNAILQRPWQTPLAVFGGDGWQGRGHRGDRFNPRKSIFGNRKSLPRICRRMPATIEVTTDPCRSEITGGKLLQVLVWDDRHIHLTTLTVDD